MPKGWSEVIMEVQTRVSPTKKRKKRNVLTESLFTDDTTFIGNACEIGETTQVIKESLALFEKRTNDPKKERATILANNIRMLGVYVGRKKDVSQRLKREALIFARIRKRLTKSRLS